MHNNLSNIWKANETMVEKPTIQDAIERFGFEFIKVSLDSMQNFPGLRAR